MQGRAASIRAYALHLAVMAAIGPAQAAIAQAPPADQSQSFTESPAQSSRIAGLASALCAAEASDEARIAAARELLHLTHLGGARLVLQSALWDDRPPGVRRAVAEAIASDPTGAGPLTRSLGTALFDSASRGGPDAEAIIRALTRIRSKDAARALIDGAVASDRADPAIASAACDALAAMTVRGSFGRDRAAWIGWWNRAQWLDEREWSHEIAAPDDAEVAAAPPLSPGARLATLYRRLHAAMPEASREGLLVEMLAEPEAEVRLAAFDLIMLSLVNAKPVGEAAAEAAAARLTDSEAPVRAEAARTIELLGRAQAIGPLLNALEAEADPRAAAAMLRAAARHPDARLVGQAQRWIEAPNGEAWTAACEAMDAARRSDLLTDPAVRESLRRSLLARPAAGWPKPAFRLAVALGEHNAVLDVLAGPERQAAIIAAEALSESRSAIELLLSAAASQPDLFPAAAASIRLHALNSDGYERLSALPASDEAQRRAALGALAAALPPDDLLAIARAQPDHAQRESLLAPLVTQEFLAATDDLPERVEVALALASTRLVLGRPSDALATLEILPTDWQGPRARALRITSLLCLGRVDDAEAAAPIPAGTEPPALSTAHAADAWIQAMEMCPGMPDFPGVLAAFDRRFNGELTASQIVRLRAIRGRMGP